MRYLRPLRSGDRFRGTCRVVKTTAARLVFEQQLWLLPRRSRASVAAHNGASSAGQQQAAAAGEEEQLVLSAEAVVVSLDSSYKPKRISPRLRELLQTGAPSAAAGQEPLQLQELL